jgi:hypothetical protein
MEREMKSDFGPIERRLVWAFILAGTAWFLHLIISDALAPESCADRTKIILHLVTVCCFAATLLAAGIAWRARAIPTSEEIRWTAIMVLVLSLSFSVVILAQEIPNLLLRSCD